MISVGKWGYDEPCPSTLKIASRRIKQIETYCVNFHVGDAVSPSTMMAARRGVGGDGGARSEIMEDR